MGIAMSYPLMPDDFRGSQQTDSRDWFARALDNARRARRLTIKETARLIGRTPKATERILAGDNAPQLDAVLAACRAFDDVFDVFREQCGRASTVSEAEEILARMTEMLAARRS